MLVWVAVQRCACFLAFLVRMLVSDTTPGYIASSRYALVAHSAANRIYQLDLISNQLTPLIGTGAATCTSTTDTPALNATVNGPLGIQLSPDGTFGIFSSVLCSALMRYNTVTGNVKSVMSGGFLDAILYDISFETSGRYAYCATIISGGGIWKVDTVLWTSSFYASASGIRSVLYFNSPDIFLFVGISDGSVARISNANPTIVYNIITVGSAMVSMSLDPTRTYLYVAAHSNGYIQKFLIGQYSLTLKSTITPVSPASGGLGLSVLADGTTALASCYAGLRKVSLTEASPAGPFVDSYTFGASAGPQPIALISGVVPCDAGTYGTVNNSCIPCDPGTYASANASTTCTECQAGTYAASTKATVCSSCLAVCSLGSYIASLCNTTMNQKCSSCAVGTYGNTTTTAYCDLCPPGTYAGSAGLSTCAKCAAGKYAAAAFASTCQSCSAGTISNALAATECTQCDVGQFSRASASLCSTCSAGTYAPNTTVTACLFCIPPLYSDAAGATACSICPAGSFTPNNSTCTPCDSGYYSLAQSSTACTACPAGFYSPDPTTLCAPCLAGSYSPTASGVCIACPANSVSGDYATNDNTYYISLDRSQYTASSTYDNKPLPTSDFGDIRLDATSYGSLRGYWTPLTSEQTPTVTAWVQIDLNAVVRVNALVIQGMGTVNFMVKTVKVMISTDNITWITAIASASTNTNGAVKGYVFLPNNTVTRYIRIYALTISNGVYMRLGIQPIASTCKCLNGYYNMLNPMNLSQEETCAPCATTPACTGSQTRRCFGVGGGVCCGAGTYFIENNSTQCQVCTNGTFSSNGTMSVCDVCVAGTYSRAGFSACVSCPPGTFSNRSNSAVCMNCPAGSYCNATTATPCDATMFCPAGSTTQTPCLQGYYCSNTLVQIICPVRSWCAAGSTASTTCDSGTYCPVGSPNMTLCKAGSFCANTATQTDCLAGKFCPPGSTTYQACPANTYAPSTGMSA